MVTNPVYNNPHTATLDSMIGPRSARVCPLAAAQRMDARAIDIILNAVIAPVAVQCSAVQCCVVLCCMLCYGVVCFNVMGRDVMGCVSSFMFEGKRVHNHTMIFNKMHCAKIMYCK